MKKLSLLLLCFGFVIFVQAQCTPQVIPSTASKITGAAGNTNGSGGEYWLCSHASILVTGNNNTIFMEDSAIVSVQGDNNTIYMKIEGHATIGGDQNFVWFENTAKVTDNGTFTTKTKCSGAQHFLYGEWPSGRCKGAVGISEIAIARKLKVYPNPVSDVLYLEIPKEVTEDVVLNLVSVNGQIVSTQQVSASVRNPNISTTDLKPGIYLLRLTSGDISVSKTVVVE